MIFLLFCLLAALTPLISESFSRNIGFHLIIFANPELSSGGLLPQRADLARANSHQPENRVKGIDADPVRDETSEKLVRFGDA